MVQFGGRNGDWWFEPSSEVAAMSISGHASSPLPDLPFGLHAAEGVGFRGSLVVAGGKEVAFSHEL